MFLSIKMILVLVFIKTQVSWMSYTNVALLKPTKQSSTKNKKHSSNAVDGVRSQKNCTRTGDTTKHWWMVDLLYIYYIHTIKIVNRRNPGSKRLTGFFIYVSVVNPLPISAPNQSFTGQLCLTHTGTLPKRGPHSLYCEQPTRGRYVYVWKSGNGSLTLCEFEVLVDEVEREMQCPITFGHKSDLDPVYWEYIRPVSFVHCLLVCMSAPETTATHAQIDTRSGKCECVQHSELLDTTPGVSVDENFDMCEVQDFISEIN